MNNHKDKMSRAPSADPPKASLERRRAFFRTAGIGILAGMVARDAEGAQKRRAKFKVLTETDRLNIGDRAKEMIEKAYKTGYEIEKKHGGCARCAVAALQESIEFVPKTKALFRAASCLDGGATPNGMQSCGAFTGSGMVIGWVCGNNEFGDTKLSHKLMREVHQRFDKQYGSVLCKDVREKANKDCPEVVGRAAMWTAEILLDQFTNYEQKEVTPNG
ncbi:MAG: C_GCAxxG_C_C family protein [Sedimentisphaerales bacterium]|nr:C_GCAxxG_C_C family protein [Sedimentisphaerales bacterium]